MKYQIFGKHIEIFSMTKPEGSHGSNFEIIGSDSLKEIGLEEKFWFRAPFYFSNEAPIDNITKENDPKNDEQWILATFLHKSIIAGELVDQFAFK